MYGGGSNDHQYAGLGIASGVSYYQLNDAGAAHVFRAGINSTSSSELFKIQGTGGAAVGGAVHSSAIFTMHSTTRGMLLPRMTKAQRNAITSPVAGLMIYQTDSGNNGIRIYDGTNWLAPQTVTD